MERVGSDGRPLEGSTWEDAEGRVLLVERVEPADPLGRQVRGSITAPRPLYGQFERPSGPYTTDLKTWAVIWRDKADRAPFRQ
jgi:hypothetical protein